MKKILFVVFSLSFIIGDAKPTIKSNQDLKQDSSINELLKKIDNINSQLTTESELHHIAYEGIGEQLKATSINMEVFGILFTVLALILGVYITWVERKIGKMKVENQKLLLENQEINQLIQKDITGLYGKLRREETVHIINRLIQIPEDIGNLNDLLLSRELENEDFNNLNKAFQKIKGDNKFELSYALLFFQHFADKGFKDSDIKKLFFNNLSDYLSLEFENDILKTINDLFNFLNESEYYKNEEIINRFFTAMANSKFKENKRLYELIFDKIGIRKNHFVFYQLLIKFKIPSSNKLMYGEYLIEKYGELKLTEIENEIINEIKLLKNPSISNATV